MSQISGGHLVELEWIAHNGASVEAGGPLTFSISAPIWSYAVSSRIQCTEPSVLEIEVSVTQGAIGFGIVDNDWKTYLTGEPASHSEEGKSIVRILVDTAAEGHLVARNRVSGSSSCAIGQVRTVPLSSIEQGTLKRLRSDRYNYWHYSYDLGDDVKVAASLPGIMDYHHLSRRVLHELVARRFPRGIKGLNVLDVGCSSGWHSFAMARQGATVTAIDYDQQQIEQAKFIQSCSSDPAERAVNFKHCDLFDFDPCAVYDLVHCSGVMYHLRDPIGGAAKLKSFSKGPVIIHSCVASLNGNYLELADSNKFIFCFQSESALVPTADALGAIFKHVGFATVERFHPFEIAMLTPADNFLPHYARVARDHTVFFSLA